MKLAICAIDDNENIVASKTLFDFEIDESANDPSADNIVTSLHSLLSDQLDYISFMQSMEKGLGIQ